MAVAKRRPRNSFGASPEMEATVRTKRAPFGIVVGAVALLVCQRGGAEELTAASSADRAVRASYEAAAARSSRGAAQAAWTRCFTRSSPRSACPRGTFASATSRPRIRAKASVEAATQSVTEQRAHVTDVTSQLNQGNASRADALRVDSAVASAEATLAEAEAQRATAEAQLGTLLT